MAAIGEIRKRSWLLVVVIVIGMLAFILGDTFSGRGGSIEESAVATVNGKEIKSSEYQKMIDAEYNKTDRAYKALYGQPAPSSLRQQLSDNYMSQYLTVAMFQAEYDKLGLSISRDEFNDLVQGQNVDPSLYEQYGLFVGPDRKFSNDSLRKLMPLAMQRPDFPFFIEKVVGEQAEKSKLQQKYLSMINKGLYVTYFEAKKDFEANGNTSNFNYVFAPYASVTSEQVSVSDDEVKAYYNEHKNEKKYEQEDKVSFQYVEMPIQPSVEDLDIARQYLMPRVELFKNADNDTTFINQNSDSKNYDFGVAKFPSDIDSIVQRAEKGDVIGPYRDGDFYKISKVLDNSSKKEAEVRHILLGDDKYTDKAAQQRTADSITRLLKAGGDFGALVAQFSTDLGSVPNGGKYSWFDEKQMVAEFTEVSFKKPINSFSQAKTRFGIHIIEVLGRRDSKQLKVATVDSEIIRSKETIALVQDQAIEFIGGLGKEVSDSSFRSKATSAGLQINPANGILVTQKELPAFGSNFMQMKKWAFSKNTDQGDISDDLVFENKVVVAQLTSKTAAGVVSFDVLPNNIKEDIRFELLNKKRAEYLKGKMAGSSLEEIAKTNSLEVRSASTVTLANPTVEAAGNEPAVAGSSFGTPLNTVSKPIEGENGVFVINVTSVNTLPAPENLDQQKEAARNQLRSNASDRAYNALKKASNMEDNRDKVNVLGN